MTFILAREKGIDFPNMDMTSPPLLTVFYSASSYRATEGGAEATVRMSPAPDRQVNIPTRMTPGAVRLQP